MVKKEISDNLFSHSLDKIINSCEVRCVNLEGPIFMHDLKKIKKIGPCVYQNEKCADYLSDSKINLALLANNHIMDYGVDGLRNTVGKLKNNGIAYIGAGNSESEAFKPFFVKIDSFNVAIMSIAEGGFGALYGDNTAGYAWFGSEYFERAIALAKEQSDIVILNVHAGAEEFDFPLPEIRRKYHYFIECGVDVIVGHHPHVVQGYEKYNEGLIFYSLGNIAFDDVDKPKSEYNPDGIMLVLDISPNKSIDFEMIPTFYSDGSIDIVDDNRYKERIAYIQKISEILSCPEEYESCVNRFCINAYEKNYKVYYNEGVVGKYHGFIGFLKLLRRMFIRHMGFDDYFLFHNLAIETHYWIARRAAYLSMKNKW